MKPLTPKQRNSFIKSNHKTIRIGGILGLLAIMPLGLFFLTYLIFYVYALKNENLANILIYVALLGGLLWIIGSFLHLIAAGKLQYFREKGLEQDLASAYFNYIKAVILMTIAALVMLGVVIIGEINLLI